MKNHIRQIEKEGRGPLAAVILVMEPNEIFLWQKSDKYLIQIDSFNIVKVAFKHISRTGH